MLIIGDASYRRQIKDKLVEVSGLSRNHLVHRRPRRVFDRVELGKVSLRLEVRSCPWAFLEFSSDWSFSASGKVTAVSNTH